MDFFSKNLPTFSRLFRTVKKEVTGIWTSVWGTDNWQSRVTQANLMDNNKNWVYVCVDKIADAVSSIPLKLMKFNSSGLDTEIFDHPALDILQQPNAQMTGRDFRYITMTHLELTGNAYWLKDTTGIPNTLFPLNPKFMTPVLARDKMSIIKYQFRQDVTTIDYDINLIIHPKYPNPQVPLVGMGTVEPVAEWVDVDNYATEFNRRFFLNSANFGGAVETNITTAEAMEQARLQFENQYKGLQNAHKLLLLPKDYKLNDQGLTPKDMQMQQADATFRDKILAAFGVPKSVVGIVEDVNRANAESSNYVFIVFTVKPKLDRLVTYLNEFFLPLFKGTDQMYFTYDDPTPENATLEINENQASLGNAPWQTVNEVRANKGLPPVNGGDVVMSLGTLSPLGGLEGAEPDDNVESEPAKALKGKRAPRPDKAGRAATTVAMKTAELFKKKSVSIAHTQFITRVTQYEQQFEKAVRDHDQVQKQEVLKRAQNFTSKVSSSDLFDKEAEITKLITVTTPIIEKLTKDEGERALEYVGKAQVNNFLKKDYSVSAVLEGIIEASVKRMARSYTQTTLDTLTSTINDGIAAGDPINKIADSISSVYGLTDEYRALRVARTEVFSAANDASKDAYKQSSVVKTIIWKTAEDELTCPFCAPLDDKIIPVDDIFFDKGTTLTVGNLSLTLDYEDIENPPLHPNCRCYILPGEIGEPSKAVKIVEEKESDEDGMLWEVLAKALNE